MTNEDIQLATMDNCTDLYTPASYSSIKATDTATKKLVINAMNNAESLSDHEGETLNVIGVFTKPGIRRARDKNGVDAPCTNTTLVCEDGTAYFSQSEGIRNAADNFMAAGLFEEGEIVPMKLVSSKLPNGNTRKTLVLV
nr:MAG TPA: Single stranded DNA binding protein [Bacteriophage sp.]